MKQHLRAARIAAVVALIAAFLPAALVFLGVEAVPTMLVPVLVAALPLFGRTWSTVRTLSLAASVLMTGVVILGLASVGLLFVPSLITLLITALLAREPARTAN